MHYNNCFWMFMRTNKSGLTAGREVIESSIGLWNIFRLNKPLKCAVLALFDDFPLKSEWNRSCTVLRIHIMKLKSLPKSTFLKKTDQVDIFNELFPATKSWSNTKLMKTFSDNLPFCRHGLSIFTELNLILLTSVNIRNRRN